MGRQERYPGRHPGTTALPLALDSYYSPPKASESLHHPKLELSVQVALEGLLLMVVCLQRLGPCAPVAKKKGGVDTQVHLLVPVPAPPGAWLETRAPRAPLQP